MTTKKEDDRTEQGSDRTAEDAKIKDASEIREFHRTENNWESAKEHAERTGKLVCDKPCGFVADLPSDIAKHKQKEHCPAEEVRS